MSPIRVALCDDHAVVRSGLRLILENASDVEVVGEVGTSVEAVELAAAQQPDVFLVDLTLGDDSGIDTTRRIREVAPETQVLVLTMHDDVEYLRGAFGAGAAGYLVKEAASVELLLAVRAVAAGQGYVHPRLGAALLADNPAAAEPDATPQRPCRDLSPREVEVLRLLAAGHTNAEVATKLFLSPRTIETHRLRIQQKLGLRTRAELLRYARNEGIE
ncbi:MAG: response regulator transcription factor [Actinomycetota bacterium]|jgi:two-component system, NarL family, response regulator NreC